MALSLQQMTNRRQHIKLLQILKYLHRILNFTIS